MGVRAVQRSACQEAAVDHGPRRVAERAKRLGKGHKGEQPSDPPLAAAHVLLPGNPAAAAAGSPHAPLSPAPCSRGPAPTRRQCGQQLRGPRRHQPGLRRPGGHVQRQPPRHCRRQARVALQRRPVLHRELRPRGAPVGGGRVAGRPGGQDAQQVGGAGGGRQVDLGVEACVGEGGEAGGPGGGSRAMETKLLATEARRTSRGKSLVLGFCMQPQMG